MTEEPASRPAVSEDEKLEDLKKALQHLSHGEILLVVHQGKIKDLKVTRWKRYP